MTSFVHSYPGPKKVSWSPVKNGKINPVGPDGKKAAWANPTGPLASVPATPYAAPDTSGAYKDSTYYDTTSGIAANLDNLKTYLVNAGTGQGLEAGIDAPAFDPGNYDPNATYSIADNVDVTNPFSRAALLKKSYLQSKAGNTNSYASRGQLYSGALQNAQDDTDFSKLGADNQLIKDFAAGRAGLYQQWLAGQNTASQQTIDAQGAAIDRHLNDPISAPPSTPGAVTGKTVDVPVKNLAARGLSVRPQGGKLVVFDSNGNPIPGAQVIVGGKHNIVRLPA